MQTLPKPHKIDAHPLLQRCPTLAGDGIAVEYFPRYVNRTYHPHAIPVVLLSYIVRGRGRHMMGDHVYEENGSSLAVTHYGQQHDIVTDAAGMDIYNLYLDLTRHALPSLPTEFRDLLPNILPLHPTFQNLLNRRVRLVFDDPAPVTALFERMHQESISRQAGSGEVLRACFRILLVECCRQAQRSGVQPGIDDRAPSVAWLERLRRHIDAHFSEPLPLTRLAQVAGVHPSYLSRAFHRYTGKTLIGYLTERRLQAALVLLRSTDDKVLSIALDCGFRDLAHFNRTFKRALAQPPTAFRRQAPR
jgi:AraC-like DNA-binding protein